MHLSLSIQLHLATTSTSLSVHPFAIVIRNWPLSVCLLFRLYASCLVYIERRRSLLALQLAVALRRLAKIRQMEEEQ